MAADRVLSRLSGLLVLVASCCCVPAAIGQLIRDRDEVEELRGVEVTEKLGETAALDAVFTNAEGERVELARYVNGSRPTILVPAYYDCPIICTIVLDKLTASLNELDYVVGRDFNLVTFSFDSTETTSHAMSKKTLYLSGYSHGRAIDISSGFQFLTGESDQIAALTRSIGYDVRRLSNGEFSHPTAIVVLSPEGAISRYVYGLDYPPRQMKLALLEAADGTIAASFGDKVLQYCFRYDPDAGAYSMEAMALMRVGGVLTILLLVVLIGGLLIGERARKALRGRGAAAHSAGNETTEIDRTADHGQGPSAAVGATA